MGSKHCFFFFPETVFNLQVIWNCHQHYNKFIVAVVQYKLLVPMNCNCLIPWQGAIKLQYSVFSFTGPVSDDGGKYMCTGTNMVGSTNMSAYLTVEYPPLMDQTNVKFWSWDQRPVTLFCKGNFVFDKTSMNQNCRLGRATQ